MVETKYRENSEVWKLGVELPNLWENVIVFISGQLDYL